MKEQLEDLLEYLSENYRPQNIEEISERINVEKDKLRRMIDFLAKYDFIQYKSKEVMIDPQLREVYLCSNQSSSKSF